MAPLRTMACASALLLMVGCATNIGPVRAPALPTQARADPSHFVVVTVRNQQHAHAVRPGSTPRGYDSAGAYGITADASSMVHGLERDYGLKEVSAWPIALLHIHCVVFRLPAETGRLSTIAQLTRDSRVESVQALNEFTAQTRPEDSGSFEHNGREVAAPGHEATAPAHEATDHGPVSGANAYNDPYAPLQPSLDQLGVVQAQRRSRGAGVRIAVIDTGMDFEHPDLRDRVVARRNFVDGDESAFKRDRHGTQVAGVIAAQDNNGIGIVGIAPAAHLLALKACWQAPPGGPHAVCNSFTLAQAMEAAIVARVDVVNLSLAGPPDPLLSRLLQLGMQQGIIYVGAVAPAGMARGFPTDIPGVLAVQAAEDSSGNPRYLLAPGHDVLTLVPQGHYDFATGNSLAAAEVSGIVALVLARSPHLSMAAANSILLRSSKQVATAAGRLTCVNAQSALDAVESSTACVAGTRCVAAKNAGAVGH